MRCSVTRPWVSAGVSMRKEWRFMAPGREESQRGVSSFQQNGGFVGLKCLV